VSRPRLEKQLSVWGTRGGVLLAATALIGLLFWMAAWAGQSRLLSQSIESYTVEEANSLARVLLYDLAADPYLKRCRFYASQMLQMARSDPGVQKKSPPIEGLAAFVDRNLSLPDAVIWNAALRAGFKVDLNDILHARYDIYSASLKENEESLSQELWARVTFSDHLRGIRIKSLEGFLDLQVGQAIPDKAVAQLHSAAADVGQGLFLVSFPLYLETSHWGEVYVLVDRSNLAAVQKALKRALNLALAGLAAFFLIVLGLWFWSWKMLISQLRRHVVSPVVRLAGRMEAWEQEKPPSQPDTDETSWLNEAFERLLKRIGSQQEQLLRAQRLGLMERIGAGLAHEINNALNPARLRVEDMLLHEAPPPREDLKQLKQHLISAQQILKDLTLTARVPEGPPKPVAPEQWLDAARRLASPHFSKGPSLIWPEPSQAPVVMGYEESLVQIALNLILNAHDAAAERGNEGRVEIRLDAAGNHCRFCVEDNGAGIPPAIRDHLFEPFVTSKARGTGLGLFVVDILARRMGGSVRFEEPPGGGTCVTVTLNCQAKRQEEGGSDER
jgi:signal transduction histidine kinase